VACDDDEKEYNWRGDWNNPSDANYKPAGYNPVQGLWKIGSRGIFFSKEFRMHNVAFQSDGTYQIDLFKDVYMINDEALRYKTYPQTWRYRIEGDKLYLTDKLFQDNDWAIYTKVEETTEE
jgi:hypothetical protein